MNENKSIDNARKGVKTLLELNEIEEHRQAMQTLQKQTKEEAEMQRADLKMRNLDI